MLVAEPAAAITPICAVAPLETDSVCVTPVVLTAIVALDGVAVGAFDGMLDGAPGRLLPPPHAARRTVATKAAAKRRRIKGKLLWR